MDISPIKPAQFTLAAAICAASAGFWAGITPPNETPEDSEPETGDSIRRLINAQKRYGNWLYMPVGLQTLHYAALVLTYPKIPPALLRHGAKNGLDARFLIWSTETAVPIAVLLGVAVPLRLLSYAGLGKNFTFGLAEPDRLNTSGLYKYMQHPSYTGAVTLAVGLYGLLGRSTGQLSCVIPPWLFKYHKALEKFTAPLLAAFLLLLFRNRVRDEEKMLRAKFGDDWEAWHARTARFIPFIF
ncbi:hypothetical protein F5Y16DRAFT_361643 [Xylariaceae sp. FL0255]|nr:hypothetical protein F5Y16DRAFT_361643 [Xylariaceae sp. FL0255]